MLLRAVLELVLIVLVARAFWRVVGGIVEGVTGGGRTTHVPDRGVPMVRDPVCGTFVSREHARSIMDGSTRVFFCSENCLEKYRTPVA